MAVLLLLLLLVGVEHSLLCPPCYGRSLLWLPNAQASPAQSHVRHHFTHTCTLEQLGTWAFNYFCFPSSPAHRCPPHPYLQVLDNGRHPVLGPMYAHEVPPMLGGCQSTQ
jgi:hypothetical protein